MMDETIIKGFSEFTLSRSGVLTTRYSGAYFRLKGDLRFLFPYINASITDTRYHDRPEYLQFFFEGIKCSLYPTELIAASFTDKPSALSFFDRFIDFVDDLNRRRDVIQPDYRRYSPPSVIDILKLLPKSNCRGCGYSTCIAFAAALRNGEATPGCCPDFVSPIATRNTYPVFNGSGHLVSTVTLEIDMPGETAVFAPADTPEDVSLADVQAMDAEMGLPPLTGREVEVLRYITAGATNTEIAENLSISPHTVKSHVVHIFNKLGVNDRTQAAVWATRHLPKS
jgi:DNA-binding CsgD family transcriptional regulator/ArsR family metal-binding transcriptional regulator